MAKLDIYKIIQINNFFHTILELELKIKEKNLITAPLFFCIFPFLYPIFTACHPNTLCLKINTKHILVEK